MTTSGSRLDARRRSSACSPEMCGHDPVTTGTQHDLEPHQDDGFVVDDDDDLAATDTLNDGRRSAFASVTAAAVTKVTGRSSKGTSKAKVEPSPGTEAAATGWPSSREDLVGLR